MRHPDAGRSQSGLPQGALAAYCRRYSASPSRPAGLRRPATAIDAGCDLARLQAASLPASTGISRPPNSGHPWDACKREPRRAAGTTSMPDESVVLRALAATHAPRFWRRPRSCARSCRARAQLEVLNVHGQASPGVPHPVARAHRAPRPRPDARSAASRR